MSSNNSWNSRIPVQETLGGTGNAAYATGDILYAAAANDLDRRTIGTAGQVLTVSGGVPVWAAVPTGGLTLLDSETVTDASSVTWDNTIITNAFSIYVIVWDSLSFSAATELRLVLSTDNASTFIATNYQWGSMAMGSESGSLTDRSGLGGIGNIAWQIGEGPSARGDNPAEMGGFLFLFTPTEATIATTFVSVANFADDSTDPDNFGVSCVGGSQTVQAAHNAIRFRPGTGTFTGNFHIYGLDT